MRVLQTLGAIFALGLAITACGTKVHVGRNSHKKPILNPLAPEVGPAGESASESAGSEGRQPESGSGGLRTPEGKVVSCLAKVDELPEGLATMCSEWREDLQAHFPEAYRRICEQRELSHMFESGCAWPGNEKSRSFLRVLARTDLKDPGETFHYVATFAYRFPFAHAQIPPAEIFFLGYADPAQYLANGFIYPKNSKVTPASAVEALPSGRRQFQYRYEMSGMRKVSFRGLVITGKINNGLDVALNVGVDEFVGLQMKRSLALGITTADGAYHGVMLEERQVGDRGLHDVAFSALRDMDVGLMQTILDNAKVE